MKRLIDVPLATIMIVIALPIMLTIAVLIRFTSPGPILFQQRRMGRHGVPFGVLKFRTMGEDAERVLMSDPDLFELYQRNGYKLPADKDPRVIPLGSFLRRTSLDELPQLFNVLRGDMSLVGPRPIVAEQVEEYYGDHSDTFLSAYPGITGSWQVSGRSHIGYPKRAKLELEYIQEWRPSLDLWLLLRTIPAVIAGRGAH